MIKKGTFLIIVRKRVDEFEVLTEANAFDYGDVSLYNGDSDFTDH